MESRHLLIVGAVLLLSLGCGDGVSELPAVPHPSVRVVDRGYTVLVQETFESETVFVVAIPGGAHTSRQALLAIARDLHRARGERPRTAVVFQPPGKFGRPDRPIEQHYADASAMGIIDEVKGIEDLRFGIFN